MKKPNNWKFKLILLMLLLVLLHCSMPTVSEVKLKANAGPDQVTMVGSYVRLDPVNSKCPVNPDAYEWDDDDYSNPDGLCILGMTNSGVLELGFDTPGVYIFTLVVRNGEERSEPDEVIVTVEPNPATAFPDPNLELAVRYQLKERTGILTPGQLGAMDSLRSYGTISYELISLQGIEQCSNLSYLEMRGLKISDLSPIAGLAKLRILNLSNNRTIPDISPLSSLTNLEELNLYGNLISDITPLQNLVNLIDLDLGENPIVDISPLANMTHLKGLLLFQASLKDLNSLANLKELVSLYVEDCGVTDIDAVKNLANLTSLHLDGNNISDISALAALTQLDWLRLEKNRVSDITALQNLDKLTYVRLTDNQVQDIKPLIDNPGIGAGDYVYLNGNPLSQESVEVYIPILVDKGVCVAW